MQVLGETDRIGDRYQHDLAAHVGVSQQTGQVVQHQHARNLVGMDAGLQIGLGS